MVNRGWTLKLLRLVLQLTSSVKQTITYIRTLTRTNKKKIKKDREREKARSMGERST